MRKLKAAELVLDFDLYPRNNVDSHNVRNICDALASGVELPPVVIDRKSKRVIDGFHRVRAYLKFLGDEAVIEVIEKTYKTESDMFLDAMKYNSGHGAKLDPCDRTHCVIIAERLSIPIESVAGALNMPVDKLASLRNVRSGYSANGSPIPLKNTVSKQFNGRKLTPRQVQANDRLSGMSQVFYVNQVIELIESKMLDLENEQLVDRLETMVKLLDGIFAGMK